MELVNQKFFVHPHFDKHRVRRNGTAPIQIRVGHQRKQTYFPTPYKIRPEYWDYKNRKVKASMPNAVVMNADLRQRVAALEKEIYELIYQNKSVSLEQIRRKVQGGSNESVVDFGLELIKELDGKYSDVTLQQYRTECARLNEFLPDIKFNDMRVEHLRRYESHLIKQGLSNNSIHKSFKILKKIFNTAIKQEITVNYPFARYDNPRYKQTDRTYLTEEEINRIEEVLSTPLSDSLRRSATWFLFGCYSGLRFSDWLRFDSSMIQGERLIIRAKKNGELVSIKIHSRLRNVIDQLDGPPLSEQKTNYHLKDLAYLAEIEKKITTHVARHSFAVRCAELGISMETTATLMGITVKTCAVYYKVTNRKIDEEFAKWEK